MDEESRKSTFTQGMHFKGRCPFLSNKFLYYVDENTVIQFDIEEKRKRMKLDFTNITIFNLVVEDDRWVFFACGDGTGRIFDITVGTGRPVVYAGHTDVLRAFIPCGKNYALSCSDDKTIRLWNRISRECAQVFSGHTGAVLSILFDEKRRHVFSASTDTTIRVWDVDTGKELTVLCDHKSEVRSIAFGEDVEGTMLLSCEKDALLRVWDVDDIRRMPCMDKKAEPIILEVKNKSSISSLAVGAPVKRLVTGMIDGSVMLSNIRTQKETEGISHGAPVLKVCTSPDSKWVAFSDAAGGVVLFSEIRRKKEAPA
jgi:WD40 repeat protein